jgi:hypothetical protein
MRDEDRVDMGKRVRIDGGPAPEMQDAPPQHRIGDDEEAVEPDRGAAVPEPGDAVSRR